MAAKRTKFEVEFIADVAGKEGKSPFYKVKWVGYDLNWNSDKGEKTAWEHSRLRDSCDEVLKEFWDGREDKPEDDIPFDDARWGRHLHFCYDCGKVFGRKQDLTAHRPPNQKQDRSERMLGQDASEQIRLQDGVRYQSAHAEED